MLANQQQKFCQDFHQRFFVVSPQRQAPMLPTRSKITTDEHLESWRKLRMEL